MSQPDAHMSSQGNLAAPPLSPQDLHFPKTSARKETRREKRRREWQEEKIRAIREKKGLAEESSVGAESSRAESQFSVATGYQQRLLSYGRTESQWRVIEDLELCARCLTRTNPPHGPGDSYAPCTGQRNAPFDYATIYGTRGARDSEAGDTVRHRDRKWRPGGAQLETDGFYPAAGYIEHDSYGSGVTYDTHATYGGDLNRFAPLYPFRIPSSDPEREAEFAVRRPRSAAFLVGIAPATPLIRGLPGELIEEDLGSIEEHIPLGAISPSGRQNWDYSLSGHSKHYGFDGSSNSSSYARSTFSTASLASSATDLSKNSGYSAFEIARATKELILILRDDEGLVPLYKCAIGDVMIGPAKLERNLRLFIKSYGEHLGELAKDRLQHLISRLVRKQAKLVALSILEKYGLKQEVSHREEGSPRHEQEQSSDEEDEVQPVDETEFHDLVSFRTFLVDSGAFVKLHNDIRSFILPKTDVDFTSSRALVDKLLGSSKAIVSQLRRDRSWTLQALWSPATHDKRDAFPPTLVEGVYRSPTDIRSLKDTLIYAGQGLQVFTHPYERRRSTSAHSFFSIPPGHDRSSLSDTSDKAKIHDESLLYNFTRMVPLDGSRAQTEAFVPPKTVQIDGTTSNMKDVDPPGNNESTTTHEFARQNEIITDTPGVIGNSTKDIVITTTGPETADGGTSINEEHFKAASTANHAGILRMTVKFVQTFTAAALIATGLLEPPLRPGRTRLRWQCSCGDLFYDDIRELREGGVESLILYMQLAAGIRFVTTSNRQHTSRQKYTFATPSWVHGVGRKVSAIFGQSTGTTAGILPHTSPAIGSACTPRGPSPVRIQNLRMLALMRSGRRRPILYQDPINKISTDKELFSFMSTQLAQRRGALRKLFSCTRIEGVRFVKFRLWPNHYPDFCEDGSSCVSSCDCIPPQDKVEPAPGAQYQCTPAGPASTCPPLPPKYLAHHLEDHKEISNTQSFVFEQLPKLIDVTLEAKTNPPTQGWGLYFQEEWDPTKFWNIVLSIFLVGSLLFGVLWSFLEHDLQGAFGVSAYMVTAAGVIVAWLANRPGNMARVR